MKIYYIIDEEKTEVDKFLDDVKNKKITDLKLIDDWELNKEGFTSQTPEEIVEWHFENVVTDDMDGTFYIAIFTANLELIQNTSVSVYHSLNYHNNKDGLPSRELAFINRQIKEAENEYRIKAKRK